MLNDMTFIGATLMPQSLEEVEERYEEREKSERISGSRKDMIYRNRTHNVAWAVCNFLKNVSFDMLEKIMYFKVDKCLMPYVRDFEKQLELAKLNEKAFRNNLHTFYSKNAEKIKKENAIQLLAQFHQAVLEAGIYKGYDLDKTVSNIFSAYLSMVEQQFCYLIDDTVEDIVGFKQDGTPITQKDIYPMIDYYQYEVEDGGMKKFIDKEHGKRNNWDYDKAWKKLQENFEKIGYPIQNVEELAFVVQSSNNYSNNLYAIMYYISERELDMLPNGYKAGYNLWDLPRKWLDTEFYKQALKKRSYTLPASGVVAKYHYTGDSGIKEIVFKEVFKDDRIILLWKMSLAYGGVTSGYFDTSSQFFYSNYMLCQGGIKTAEAVENFILENYYLLTCKNIESERKQRLRMIITQDDTPIEQIIRWGKQPIVEYSCMFEADGKKDKKNGKARRYQQGEYDNSKIAIGANVRKLPVGYKASEEALTNAEKYGYEIEDGYTFVLPFERNQRHIKIKV